MNSGHNPMVNQYQAAKEQMNFNLVDTIVELEQDHAIVVKDVREDESYLADHFPGFPILPGVFMLEVMIQAARKVTELHGHPRTVLGQVKTLRYGNLVRPGQSLRVRVELKKTVDDQFDFKGSGQVLATGAADNADEETAVSGRFTMRPMKCGPAGTTGQG